MEPSNASHSANCHRARANGLALATRAAGRCCNAVRVVFNSSGAPTRYLQCRGDAEGLWVVAYAVALICVMILSSVTFCRRQARKAARRAELAASAAPSLTSTPRAPPRPTALGSRALAGALLHQMSVEVRERRQARIARLVATFGFQESSAQNQLRHFESLLLSHISQEGDGDATNSPQEVVHPHAL